jgi:hypothetical protein
VSVQSPTKVEEKEKRLSGKIEVDFVAPDRFRKRVSSTTLRGFGYSYAEVVNGQRAWRDPPLPVRSSHRDARVIDVGDVERSLTLQAQNAQQQMAFYTLGWLLQPPPAVPLKLGYAGEFQTEGRVAEVLVAQGADDFRLVLLLDQQTRLPLAVVVPFIASRQATVLVEAAGATPKFIQNTYLRARQERQARVTRPQRYELWWRFSDHRPVAGVRLPHRLTTTLNSEVLEEMVITEFTLNRPINPKKFDGQPAVRY